jgi:hypothetical protein
MQWACVLAASKSSIRLFRLFKGAFGGQLHHRVQEGIDRFDTMDTCLYYLE